MACKGLQWRYDGTPTDVPGFRSSLRRVSWGIGGPGDLAENTETINTPDRPSWLTAVRAAESRKAQNVRVLDLRGVTSFADYFVICNGTNPRQIQAISDAVGEELEKEGERAVSIEGYQNAEWILVDYGDFLVHIFSEKSREYYQLERLWR